ncbi:unnamed protein product [Ambrosiozyma monospora]|nr:unnamed protein product [Ambrosiozyma monospora]
MWWDSEGDSSDCKRSLVMQFVDELGGVKNLGVATDKGDKGGTDDGNEGNKTNNNNTKSGACAAVKKPTHVLIFSNVMLAVLLSLM